MTNWLLIAITTTFTLMFSVTSNDYAFHENLGLDDNKASELYHTNPNDPDIVQWQTALQSAINSMDKPWISALKYSQPLPART